MTTLALMGLSIFDHLPWYANAILISLFLIVYWAWKSHAGKLAWTVFFARQVTAKKEFYESLLDGDDFQDEGPLSLKLHYNAKTKLLRLALRQGIPLLVGCALLFGVCWFFSSVCMAFEPVSLSFKGMRALSPEVCDSGLKPCLLYLTIAGNSSSSVFVVFHTNYKMKSPNVKLSGFGQPSPSEYEISVPAEYIEMNLEVTRFVYMAYLSHLEPQRTIYFVAGDGQVKESYSKERTFQPTASSLTAQPLKIVSAGDVGATKTTATMLKAAASRGPSMFVFGGDLAYANGMKTCYRRWDRWLKLYSDNAISPDGLTIPLLTSIGNHEAGGWRRPRKNAPFYLNYFFHQGFNTVPSDDPSLLPSKPPAADANTKFRPSNIPTATYHAHDISGTTFLVLDTDVLASPASQTQFIENTLQNAKYGPKPCAWSNALYHAPMYPSVRSESDHLVKALRASWAPIFSKYVLDIAFENHDHAYKRTFPLLNGRVAKYPERGTVYLGDGAFGVHSRKPDSPQQRSYLAHTENEIFYFVVTYTTNNVTIQAINQRSVVFDSHTIRK